MPYITEVIVPVAMFVAIVGALVFKTALDRTDKPPLAIRQIVRENTEYLYGVTFGITLAAWAVLAAGDSDASMQPVTSNPQLFTVLSLVTGVITAALLHHLYEWYRFGRSGPSKQEPGKQHQDEKAEPGHERADQRLISAVALSNSQIDGNADSARRENKATR